MRTSREGGTSGAIVNRALGGNEVGGFIGILVLLLLPVGVLAEQDQTAGTQPHCPD